MYLLHIKKMYAPWACTGSLSNTAGAELSCLETRAGWCHPALRTDGTKKEEGSVSTSHIWEFFLTKGIAISERIIYHG